MVLRFFISLIIFFSINSVCAREINILIVGDAIHSDCVSISLKNSVSVYHIENNFLSLPKCTNGMFWGSLGQKLIEEMKADNVRFFLITADSTLLNDWLPGGIARGKLVDGLDLLIKRKVNFNYVFFIQPFPNIKIESFSYSNNLKEILTFITIKSQADKLLIAHYSGCKKQYKNNELILAHGNISNTYLYRRYPGPNLDSLNLNYDSGRCFLSKGNREKMANLWLNSIMNAEVISNSFEKETLIYYFK